MNFNAHVQDTVAPSTLYTHAYTYHNYSVDSVRAKFDSEFLHALCLFKAVILYFTIIHTATTSAPFLHKLHSTYVHWVPHKTLLCRSLPLSALTMFLCHQPTSVVFTVVYLSATMAAGAAVTVATGWSSLRWGHDCRCLRLKTEAGVCVVLMTFLRGPLWPTTQGLYWQTRMQMRCACD